MALIVGTDTYSTQAEATTYVTQNYATISSQAIAWTALSSDNKDAYLRQACKAIDRQRLVGIKSVANQTLEFPRAIPSQADLRYLPSGYTQRDYGWLVQVSVPDSVKYAQIEEALALIAGVSARTDLQRQGVKSFSLGNLSENYGAINPNRLASYEAQQLLAAYVAGNLPIV